MKKLLSSSINLRFSQNIKKPIRLSSVILFTMLMIVIFFFILLQLSTNRGSLFGFSYWLIPDSVIHYDSTHGLVTGKYTLEDIPAGDGVPVYYSFFSSLGVLGFFLANILLITVSIKYFDWKAIAIALLLYPHYLQMFPLPSKDMMVLTVYFVAFSYLIKNDWIKVVPIAIAAYFIRDAMPFLLFPVIGVTIILHKTKIKPVWIVVAGLLVGALAFANLKVVAPDLFVVGRNLNVFNSRSSETLQGLGFGVVGYLARIFFNLTNFAFRLTFIDEAGLISIQSLFLYISGISSLVCAFIAIRYIFIAKGKTLKLVSTSYVITLFIISINPFVQGRYLLPMSVVASQFFFRRIPVRVLVGLYVGMVVVGLVARFYYWELGIPFPLNMEYYPVDLLTLVK